MKRLLAGALISLLLFSSVSAWEETNIIPWYKTPVIDNSLNFEASRNEYKVELKWDAYSGDNFQYYKVMRSETHKNPVYPDQQAIQYYDTQDQEIHELKDWASIDVYYRICIITTDKWRICSNVATLEGVTKDEMKSYQKNKSDYIKIDKKTAYKKIVPTIKKYEKKSQVNIDAKLQQRADKIVTNLTTRLDNKYGSDNDSKINKIIWAL